MINVILAENSRTDCCNPRLSRYTAGGIVLALLKQGLDARFFDLKAKVSQKMLDEAVDVCCYGVFFGNKVNAFRHMQNARKSLRTPRLIIAFGPFASVFPDEILSRGLADIVVSHDPEFVIPLLLGQDSKLGVAETIPNVSYRHEGKIVHHEKRSFHDLDEIPFVGPYLYSQGHRPTFTMTARGCQYHCVFCDRNVLWGGGVRHRRVSYVIDEIKELVEKHHVPKIDFIDEDLAADHQRLAALCEGIRGIQGDFYWTCSACVDSVDQQTLLLMGRSGCREIAFGVESASEEVLRRIGKTYGRQEILNAVRWAQEAGLKVDVLITIGNPGETDEDQKLTLSALGELGPGATVRTNRLVVLPGTALYRRGLRDGSFTQESFFEDEGIIFYKEHR